MPAKQSQMSTRRLPSSACWTTSQYRKLLSDPQPAPAPAVPILEDLYNPDAGLTPAERNALIVVIQLVRRRVLAALAWHTQVEASTVAVALDPLAVYDARAGW